MQLEIITFCDAATEYGGRLNILGATDSLGQLNCLCATRTARLWCGCVQRALKAVSTQSSS